MEPAREQDAQLQEAKRWLAEINSCSRNKPSLERAQQLVAWDPPPVYVSGLAKLKDAVASAQNWLAKEQQVGLGGWLGGWLGSGGWGAGGLGGGGWGLAGLVAGGWGALLLVEGAARTAGPSAGGSGQCCRARQRAQHPASVPSSRPAARPGPDAGAQGGQERAGGAQDARVAGARGRAPAGAPPAAPAHEPAHACLPARTHARLPRAGTPRAACSPPPCTPRCAPRRWTCPRCARSRSVWTRPRL
jgi:hypothetical protein